ncbi:splicing factor 3B subunit 4-like [Mizuhopecten yessoensis]|uniref:splicing factor 3B subunit 4-like n=1 Tax=Mizuhopecten yessoensis TaxID=6573 RepID=UPI000B45C7FC|nr:splicing factor 3B subunit 4-like [Mizuhopecten yessoensis]
MRGLQQEDVSTKEYTMYQAEHGLNVTVEKSGLIIHPSHNFLAASPDGKVFSSDGQNGLIEIKNMLQNKNLTLREAFQPDTCAGTEPSPAPAILATRGRRRPSRRSTTGTRPATQPSRAPTIPPAHQSLALPSSLVQGIQSSQKPTGLPPVGQSSTGLPPGRQSSTGLPPGIHPSTCLPPAGLSPPASRHLNSHQIARLMQGSMTLVRLLR